MIDKRIENLNVDSEDPIITPDRLKAMYPRTENVVQTVMEGQQTIKKILDRTDHRLFLVVGPCSIHDVAAAKDYATRLKKLAQEVEDTFLLVMRIYFEKPRTRVDCSHDNSQKDPARQPFVMRDITHQILEGNESIIGLMIESNLEWGQQAIGLDPKKLKYGVSVTDACLDWQTTKASIRDMYDRLKDVLPVRKRLKT